MKFLRLFTFILHSSSKYLVKEVGCKFRSIQIFPASPTRVSLNDGLFIRSQNFATVVDICKIRGVLPNSA